jgi:hypothetical protein
MDKIKIIEYREKYTEIETNLPMIIAHIRQEMASGKDNYIIAKVGVCKIKIELLEDRR